MRAASRGRVTQLRRSVASQKTRLLAVLVTLLAMLFVAFLVWRIPHWYEQIQTISDAKERISLENEIFKNVVEAVGGAFVLGGLFFTARTFALNREGQITERFSKAVEHLGSDQLSIRLGGIHALARIANDSPKDAQPIMEILCAFVRNGLAGRTGVSKLPLDVSAALALITTGEKGYSLDLSEVDLSGAKLQNSVLDSVNFEGSNLEGTHLERASLRGCRFRGANLMNSYLRYADLEGADLVGANLTQATLRNANLRSTNLLAATLSGASMFAADFRDAKYATRDQFETGLYDDSTVLPQFSERPGGDLELFT